MCLAIFKPAKVKIPEERLSNGWISNPDGAGFAYVDRGKVVVEKGFMNLKDFLAAYKKTTEKFKSSPFLVHFRIRSMGDKTADNTHPFRIKDGVMIHNGGFDGTGAQHQTGPSDTRLFAQRFGDLFTFETLDKHKKDFEEAIGWNKVAILYDDGKHIILNETKGEWVDDVWYSNFSWRSHPRSSSSRWDMMDDDWETADAPAARLARAYGIHGVGDT